MCAMRTSAEKRLTMTIVLQTIKAADIATVRKLGKPPYLVTLIMDVVLILFQRKVDQVRPDMERDFFFPNWAESLKVMIDTYKKKLHVKFRSAYSQSPETNVGLDGLC